MEHEVLELIEMLYAMVSEAWGVPLGNDKCIVERDKMISILDEMKSLIPVEIAEAKRLVAAKNEFIGNAKREAESIRRVAEERARQMLDQQEIIKIARNQSNEMLSSAESKSKELRRVANEYVDDALKRTEEAVAAALAEIRESRSRFRSAATAPQQQVRQLTPDDIEELD